MSWLSDLRENWRREEVRSISRRYFVSNGFDGALTAIGIAVGAFLTGIESGFQVFMVGIGAMIGLSTSGFWSVWEIEKAEKLAELRDVEDSMLRDLEDTRLHSIKKQGRAINAVMSGLGPALVMVLALSPFVFTGFLSGYQTTLVSIGIGSLLLFGFGSYMGKISGRKWYIAGTRMGLAGIFVALLNYFLPG
ncbi:MAG: VIT1/CCC1 transporter family protein [Candidatus Nanohaloarchaea archaeon]